MKHIKKFESLSHDDKLTVENLIYIIQSDVDDGIIFEYEDSSIDVGVDSGENIYDIIGDGQDQLSFDIDFGSYILLFVNTNFIISYKSYTDECLNITELTELLRLVKSLDDKSDRVSLQCVLKSVEFASECLQFTIKIKIK